MLVSPSNIHPETRSVRFSFDSVKHTVTQPSTASFQLLLLLLLSFFYLSSFALIKHTVSPSLFTI